MIVYWNADRQTTYSSHSLSSIEGWKRIYVNTAGHVFKFRLLEQGQNNRLKIRDLKVHIRQRGRDDL